jgi:regulator of sirC expression with transglutaminase-like and TPR domain
VYFFSQKGTETNMKVVNSESFSRIEHISKKEVISFIVRLIFSVAEVNKNFPTSKKLQEKEKNISKAKEKISKQQELLSKFSLLKQSLIKKASFLKNENSEAKSKLLTKLRVEE